MFSAPLIGLLRGAELAIVVAAPPGATWAMCVAAARISMKATAPVIAAAAAADCVYSTVCIVAHVLAGSTGLILALRWSSPVVLALTAVAIWPHRSRRTHVGAATTIAALNPATLGVWMALGTGAAASHFAMTSLAFVPVGALLASTWWYTLVAVVSRRLARNCHRHRRWARMTPSVALATLAAIQLSVLLGL